MKKYIAIIFSAVMMLMSSCNDYIDVLPKGMRIPTTLQDFEALMRNEYSANYLACAQVPYLLNDKFVGTNACRNQDNLTTCHYMWKEDRDRTLLNASTEDVFDNGYGIIGVMNTIIENAPGATDATDAEKNEVLAYAYAVRAFVLFQIVNYYADAYDPVKADATPGVPLIYSANLNAPWHQGSVKEVYDQILSDFNKSIELGVPEKAMTAVQPDRGAVEAGLARVYLSMREYDKALAHAEAALDRNSRLFDWNDFYAQYKDRVDNPDDYNKITSPMDHVNVENFWFCSGNGNPNYPCSDIDIPEERRAMFEPGDVRALCRWKKYQSQADVYYRGMLTGYYNLSGIATPEVYLIKAECQVRKGNITDGLETLDTVRKTRLAPDSYTPSAASDEGEAIAKIRRAKADELINSIYPFIDAKRLNAEGKYTVTLTKTFDDKAYTLSPTSHLWTMVFPANAINRPGNGTLTQNSK